MVLQRQLLSLAVPGTFSSEYFMFSLEFPSPVCLYWLTVSGETGSQLFELTQLRISSALFICCWFLLFSYSSVCVWLVCFCHSDKVIKEWELFTPYCSQHIFIEGPELDHAWPGATVRLTLYIFKSPVKSTYFTIPTRLGFWLPFILILFLILC